MSMKKTNLEMKNKEVKVPSLSVNVAPERKMPSIKPSHNTKYKVSIIRAWGPDTKSKEGGDSYRVSVWPENLEIMSEETKWVMTETGDPTFEQSFTFHHHSPLSAFKFSLEVVRSQRSSGSSQLVESPTAKLAKTVIGTGRSDLVPTEPEDMIEDNVTIFDENKHCSGTILVRVVKVE